MKEHISDEEKREFYKNCPDGMEVLETKAFDMDLLRYHTINLDYVCA